MEKRILHVLFVFIISFSAVILILLVLGETRWRKETRRIHRQMETSRKPVAPDRYTISELRDLPEPVQRYFQNTLRENQPLITAVHLEHTGFFNTSEDGECWRPFTSRQRVITQPAGFDWDAKVWMLPGVVARVHDAYAAGRGVLFASLYGLIPLVNLRDTPEIGHGELMRYLAESPWYPTVLLPGQGVIWDPVDDQSARATLHDGVTTVSMVFRFSPEGQIHSVYAEARGRSVEGKIVPTPWEGKWSDYTQIDGMSIPLQGEVSWILPGRLQPYWRGKVTSLRFEFAPIHEN